MWKTSRRLINSCIQCVMRCGRSNVDLEELEDIPQYDVRDIPVHFRPQTFNTPISNRQNDIHQRPNTPCIRRNSPPEVVTKMRQALEEMNERKPRVVEKARGDHETVSSMEVCKQSRSSSIDEK
ncbi:uncharacterized protein LOC107267812 [Cephus cinctus]|uniref:Uncharacterized protein LOC107267812 n=1 Tax=Cephus cinctus TaxID=211228 RepID=A0AAJ7BVP0_CEPCN|nr:uncharacterized protein LOC107267812 [Cephus cinctus]